MHDGAGVLGQARAAEGEAGLEINRRDVELGVAAEDVHHRVAVDAGRLAHIADLVAEADLERVPHIVGIFDHLAGLDRGGDERRLDAVIELRSAGRCGRRVGADHRHRRLVEILDRATFAQELRIVHDGEMLAGAASRGALEGRQHDAPHRARQHGRA